MGAYKTKQYIIARADLNMPAGKLAAQAAHASVGALLNASLKTANKVIIDYCVYPDIQEWMEGSFAKVCLAVNSEEELKECYEIAKSHNLPCAYIVDNGTTVFHGIPTPTCVGIGPAQSTVLEPLFKHLKLYK